MVSGDSNAEVRLEISASEVFALPIPENKSDSYVFIPLQIEMANNTSAPIPQFSCIPVFPEIMTVDQQKLCPLNSDNQPFPDAVSIPQYPIGVGNVQSFELILTLYWSNDRLWLDVPILIRPFQFEPSTSETPFWTFEIPRPGKYSFQLKYLSLVQNNSLLETSSNDERRIEEVRWMTTSPIHLQLVQSKKLEERSIGEAAIEVDNICFRTKISKQIEDQQIHHLDGTNSAGIGFEIANNTLAPLRFSFYSSLVPELVTLSGQIIKTGRESDTFGSRYPSPSDFPLVMPGEVISFFPNVSFFSARGKARIHIAFGDKSSWVFHCPKEIYKFRFSYAFLDTYEQRMYELKLVRQRFPERIWSGYVQTPYVELRL